jgi:hypothetical protein
VHLTDDSCRLSPGADARAGLEPDAIFFAGE